MTTADNTIPRTIVIGYGNPYRKDDGVALFIMNRLRERCTRPPLSRDDSGEDDLGHPVDTLMAHQLLPELAPLLSRYDRAVFIDAHAGSIPQAVRVLRVEEEKEFQAVFHHMAPGLLLHFTQRHAGRAPEAWLVSVRGYDFDYGETLTDACRTHATEAESAIAALLET